MLDSARKDVAGVINAKPDEIVFTGGGSESDNMALRGAVAASKKGKHVITSAWWNITLCFTRSGDGA
ncbi:MAG: aminotransferase class V-fold PLP-dependent enzyme [Eubacteriales bacterium]